MIYLNNVKFRKFALISISLLLAFNGLIALDRIVEVPLLRQIVGFVFLTFIPGYTILRILRIHTKGVESLLLAVGLSLFYVMITGLFANFIYPCFGIYTPISLTPLLITLDVTYIALLFFTYIRDRGYEEKTVNKFSFNPIVLAFTILPFLAIFGAYVFNAYNIPTLIMALFLLSSLVPFIVFYADSRYYPYLIWILALSILYAPDFGVSWNYIWGYDINHEYYLSNLVIKNGFWDHTIYSNVNAMLSVVILNPVYSTLLNLTPITVFKVVYPFILSLVPVALYKTYTNILSEKKSFLAVFFFISLYTYFTEMLALARQIVVELYLALIILLIFSNLDRNRRYTLLLIFTFSLIVSHYGTTYLFLFSLILAFIVHSLIYRNERAFLIRPEYIALFYAMVFIWYTLISSSSPFDTIVRTGNIILSNIYDLLDPYKTQGLYLIVKSYTGLREFAKYYVLATQAMIVIGILWLVFNIKKIKFNNEFVSLALVWFAFDIYGLVLPYFSNALNATRLYQLTLFFLSPFEVIGFLAIVGVLSKLTSFKLSEKITMKSLATFLAVYLIITSGVLFYIAKDEPYPAYFDKKISAPRWTDGEIISGLWIKNHRKDDYRIYADLERSLLFLGLLKQSINEHTLLINSEENIIQPKKASYNYYLFLGSWNIKNKKLKVIVVPFGRGQREELPIKTPEVFNILLQSNKIYSSQNSQYFFRISLNYK